MKGFRAALALVALVSSIAFRADALTVLSATAVGPKPALITVNPLTKKAFVAAPGATGPGSPGDVVTVLDTAVSPPAVTASIPVGVDPYGIDVNIVTNKVYVANVGSGTVSVINGLTSAVTATILSIPGAAGVAVNPVTNRVYVMSTIGAIFVINGVTDTLLGPPMPVIPPGKTAFLVEVNPVLNRVFVPEWIGGVLHVLDGLTLAHIAAVPLPPFGFGPTLGGVAVHPLTQDIYVTNEKGGLYRLDGFSHALLAMTPVGIPPALPFGTWGVEVDAVKSHVYVAQFETNSVHVFDATSLAPLGFVLTGPAGPGPTSGPHFTALDPLAGKLYVTNELASTVSVVSDP